MPGPLLRCAQDDIRYYRSLGRRRRQHQRVTHCTEASLQAAVRAASHPHGEASRLHHPPHRQIVEREVLRPQREPHRARLARLERDTREPLELAHAAA